MIIKKEIKDNNEFYLWFNGKLIFKKWLNDGNSKVFDRMAWSRYTERSITDFDLEETPPLYHVTCTLTVLSKEDGGMRTTPIYSGYRPDHVFEYESNGRMLYAFIGDIQFDTKSEIQVGETKIVVVRFLAKQPIEKYLDIGRKWWMHEGPNKIGEAEIIKVELPNKK